MSNCVIDTSALITFIFNEPGARETEGWLNEGAWVSTAVLQELVTHLIRRGFEPNDAIDAFQNLGVTTHDLTSALAIAAAELYRETKSMGLSHGDLSCLALASSKSVPVVTADANWVAISPKIGVQIEQVR